MNRPPSIAGPWPQRQATDDKALRTGGNADCTAARRQAVDGGTAVNSAEATSAEVSSISSLSANLDSSESLLLQLERRWPPASSIAGDTSHGEPADNSLGEETPLRIGHYVVERELGRGGFGVVLLATDSRDGRQVALKIPRPEVLSQESVRNRFLLEAETMAAFSHPNILRIHEVGQIGPINFIASEYCSAGSLADVLAGGHYHPTVREAAELVRQLAGAVQYVHSRGLLHRDLKPSNIMLAEVTAADESDKLPFRPLLTDFGLAKLVEQSAGETRSGALLGTPLYMAPEQAACQHDRVCSATDVYSLGVILYELLAGRPPFVGNNVVAVLNELRTQDPPPLRKNRPQISRNLEAIVLRCLEKTPERRYATAAALADDLAKFLGGRRTEARPISLRRRSVKWMRRHPMAVAVLSVVALAISGFAIGGTWHVTRLQRELAINQRLRHEAEQRELVLRRGQYLIDMQNADRAWKDGKLQQTLKLLTKYQPKPGDSDFRDFIWGFFWHRANAEQLRIADQGATVSTVRCSPDGRRIATAGHDGTARIYKAKNGKPVAVLRGHQGNVNCLEFIAGGEQIVTAADDGTLKFWSVPAGELLQTVAQHQGDVLCLAVHPQEKWIASAGVDHVIRLWDYGRSCQLGELKGHTDWIRGLAFSPSGDQLASTGHDGTARCWDMATTSQLWSVNARVGDGLCIAWQPARAELIAVGGHTGKVMLLSTKNGGRKGTIKTEQNWVRAMVFASTGNSLTTVGERPVMKKWNTREGLSLKLQREWTVHADQVWSVAYSHDRQSLATSSSDGTVKLWSDDGRYDFSVGITRTKHEILRQRRGVTADGRRIVFAAANILEVWDIPKRRRLQSLGGTGPNFGDFSCSTEANNIITCGSGRPVEIWNVRTKVVEHVLPEWANNAESVVLHPNGADAIVSAPGLPIRVWSRTQQRTIAEYPLHTASYAQRLKISPDGRVLAAIESPSNEVVFWDLSTGNETRPRRCADGSDLVFSPDGNRLAYVAADWTARIWNFSKRQEDASLVGKKVKFTSLAWSPDSQLLASLMSDDSIQLWDVVTERPTFEVHGIGSGRFIEFAEGGKSLAIGAWLTPTRSDLAIYPAEIEDKQFSISDQTEQTVSATAASP